MPGLKANRLVTKASVQALLDHEQSAFDRLMAEVRNGPRDQNHWNELEELGQRIARGIVAAFRGGHR